MKDQREIPKFMTEQDLDLDLEALTEPLEALGMLDAIPRKSAHQLFHRLTDRDKT
jgi:hypothetical protein